ncbi:hypothetical protein 2A_00019 [Ralstonia phage Darius]|uniref:N-acetylmuramidase domain-containing protein n=6 Tax=Caudoviricetes TaxID=2731619 RepID=A0A7G5B9T4_9CAUD|nr:endolysin [Ralstonia phage Eline]YP_010078374.1 endolysin [Ralstonia phage Gamede]YP_010078660.1 endolysin [Ralstonia phage Claudette]YP_010078691.1 endolysin [Ralstonia phage Gervaise]QMV32462.1 hypothetical protein 20A_00012 [Ralstonia phage Alix]QMV32771.1 hypothetical protein 2A_00019 [Ralstonia phage Darius]QMV33057.1 hypothetical protein 3Fb_00054 [Ralstonia phage Eline]QMV33269.1 hypothetical protein 1Ca_00031 [Ralstonia phage Gervaise]QOQ37808.1 hypothetical protein 9Ga_00046 [Ra
MPQTSKQLTADDYARAATALGVPVAAVKAVTEVESNGKGFLPDGRPLILFERHIMRRQLVAAGHAMDAARYNLTDPNIVNSKPGGYVGGAGEWDRLARAIEINRPAALESASWGLFQIMGFHWKLLGFASVQAFVNAMYTSEGAQLDAFVAFVKASPNLLRALRAKNWPDFARGYNGPGYATNKYDTKLAEAYARHSQTGAA